MSGSPIFNDSERRTILSFVRAVIAADLEGGETPEIPPFPRLAEHGSCFVTIHEAGELRGCIGNLEAFEPLGRNLIRNAVNASRSDPRFPPLTSGELDEVVLEVSLLTPPGQVPSVGAIELGRDGIILRARGRSAVFLPQVPVEQHWDKATTLSFLARKAGLPADAWQYAGAEFFTFRAEVFGEEHHGEL